MSEISKRDYDREAQNNENREYRYQIDETVRKFFLLRHAPYFQQSHQVLEIGSHDGSMTSQLLQYFDHIDILEPALSMHPQLRNQFANQVSIFPVSTNDFSPNKQYDLIFMVHVLEHIENSVETLCHVSEWLKSDGLILVMVPNAYALSRQIAKLMGLMNHETDVLPGERLQGHVKTYDLNDLITETQKAGLEVIESGGILFKPLANFQFDSALSAGIISPEYLNALNELSKNRPQESSSIYVVAGRKST